MVFSIYDFGLQFDVEYNLQGILLCIFLLFMITGLFSDPDVSLAPSSKIHSIYARRNRVTHPYKRTEKIMFLYFNLFMHALK